MEDLYEWKIGREGADLQRGGQQQRKGKSVHCSKAFVKYLQVILDHVGCTEPQSHIDRVGSYSAQI